MSLQTRQYVANHVVFQDEHSGTSDRRIQRDDVMNPDHGFNTLLIAQLERIVKAGWIVEITSGRRDHRDDSDLGCSCHWYGFALDFWPLRTRMPGDYLDEHEPLFLEFLRFLAGLPDARPVGLALDANPEFRDQLLKEVGGQDFPDHGGDHVHFGTLNPEEEHAA